MNQGMSVLIITTDVFAGFSSRNGEGTDARLIGEMNRDTCALKIFG